MSNRATRSGLKRSIQAAPLSIPGIKKALFDLADTLALKAGESLATGAGVGITGGTGTVYQSSISEDGGIVTTRILLDLTGLQSSTTLVDIIGKAGGPAHLGQITAAENGTVFGGSVECLEAPVTGVTDIDLYSAVEGTGVFDAGIATLDETALLAATEAWTLGMKKALSAVPAANEYLYLANGAAGTVGTYTAGKFLIELLGYRA